MSRLLRSARDDLLSDRTALSVVAVEESLARAARTDQSELPSQIILVLDRSVASKSVCRRMTMSGVADQKDAALPVLLGDEIVYLPLGYLFDLIFHGAIANCGLDLLPNTELRYVPPGKIVPKEERIPFIPGIDARPDAKKHLASGMIDEGQRTGAVPNILGQIRL